MLKRLRRRTPTLRFTLLVIVLLCWLLPTVTLGAYMGGRVLVSLQGKTEAALISGAEYAQTLAVANIAATATLARDAVYDTDLSDAVLAYESGASPYEDYYLLVRNYLDRKFSREQSCTFALFYRAQDLAHAIYTSQGYSQAVLFTQNMQAQALKLCETLDTRSRFIASSDGAYLVRNLHNARMQRYGVLVLGLDMDRLLRPILQNAAAWSSACAISLDDVTVGAFQGPAEETGLVEDGAVLRYTQSMTVGDSRLRYQIQADSHAVYREMDEFRLLMAWLLILFVPICIAIMLFVNRRIVKPIAMLVGASDRIRQGELGVVVPMRSADELGRLGVAFSEMSLRLKELIDRSYREQIALRDARIQALQSRINPHFINNALEAINWQARLTGAQSVSEMVETLSVLLNASLDRSEQHLVPLREELGIVDAYLYFVGIQFGERLTVEKDVDAAMLDTPLPRLVVQTLIENAVEHGIAPAGGGRIRLRVWRSGDELAIEVVNNGKLLTADELDRLRAMLLEPVSADGHLGIRNVNLRLQLIFGEAAGLRISLNGQGETVAAIRQPLRPS